MEEYLKNNWIEITAICVSVISAIVAFSSWRLSKKDFLLTHRPFLWVENFAYLDENNKAITLINTIMIKVINSAAKVLSEKYSYYTLKDNSKNILEEQNIKGSLKYPSDKVQYINKSANITKDKLRENVYRFIRIEYEWLSSDKKYFFEGTWKYNQESETWDIVYQKAN